MPNTLSDDTIEADSEVKNINSNKQSTENKIEFNSYVNKYTVRSSGRVIFMDNLLSNLSLKLKNFLITHNSINNFIFMNCNDLVEDKWLYIAGQMPNLKDFLFRVSDNLFCSPTGEVSILEYIIKKFGDLVKNNLFPLYYTTYTSCYRNEDANHSSFNKPLIRQNVFHKVETFAICKFEQEQECLNYMLNNVCNILNMLKFNYRILRIGSIEMSNTAHIQYDVEIFLPISNKYIEISSCSSCNIYQLSRDCENLSKDFDGLHCTLNCSALPIERLLAAYIEYYWNDKEKYFEMLPTLDSNQQPFG